MAECNRGGVGGIVGTTMAARGIIGIAMARMTFQTPPPKTATTANATIRASEDDTEVLMIAHDTFKRMLREFPSLEMALRDRMAERQHRGTIDVLGGAARNRVEGLTIRRVDDGNRLTGSGRQELGTNDVERHERRSLRWRVGALPSV